MTGANTHAVRRGTGLVMPAETLLFLGCGVQGAAAVRTYGLASSDIDTELSGLERRLEESNDQAAASQLAATRLLAGASRIARSWMAVTTREGSVPPTLLLTGPESVLAAILHGPVAEYAFGGADLIARTIAATREAARDQGVHVTVFDAEDALASARFERGIVDVAARRPETLEQLTTAAKTGLDDLMAALHQVCLDPPTM